MSEELKNKFVKSEHNGITFHNMIISTIKSENEIASNIKSFILQITGIVVDELETDEEFKLWLGNDGERHLAMGIKIDKLKYPDGFKYNAYVALLVNITIMMAGYPDFMGWIEDIKNK